MSQVSTLVFEIGTEEIPAFDLHAATKQLETLAAEAFNDARIPHGTIAVYSTPRRLIVQVADVATTTEASVEEFRGPAASIAFDQAGNLTQAGAGFARSKGVEPESLERRVVDGTEYLFAVKKTEAQDVASLLPSVLKGIIEGISWPKSQRWGSRFEQFSRPVRWLLALLGDTIIPVEFAGLTASNITRGHRFLSPGPHTVPSADKLIEILRGAFVIPSEAEREAAIRAGVAEAEAATGLKAELPAKTLTEVINLTEYPTIMVGEFDPLFLAVPKEITVDAMLVHQRYFPLFNADGALANKFLITSNGNPHYSENIIDGNQRVVAARLYDAKFFYDEDLKKPLEAYVAELDNVVFQEALGTMRQKTTRVVALTEHLVKDAQLAADEAADAKRVAQLAKADLVTGAVVEFTSVQGIMGSYYALASGENPRVAEAIADHYRPRFSGDDLPATTVGRMVAFADKLDTICGLFAIDQAPTGSSDPFALRRAAIGIVAMLEAGLPVSLGDAVDASLATYAAQGLSFDEPKTRTNVLDFFITRTKVILRDEGIEADTIEAVLATGVVEPAEIAKRARALEEARTNNRDVFDDLATAFARANNLRDAQLGSGVDETKLLPVESTLRDAIAQAKLSVQASLAANNYADALGYLAALRVPIDVFFADVMVMDEDIAVRENRLRLLNCFTEVFADVADFGLMAKKA